MAHDVIVVGAGPAGASLAMFLAEAGASVALVDGAAFPRPKPCGGWVNARAVSAFKHLDAARRKVKATPFRRLVFHSPDIARQAVHTSRAHLGYIVDRARFDAALVERAAKAGADVITGRSAAAVQTGERDVTVQLTSRRKLSGRLLVGADGARSTVAAQTGLRERWADQQLVHCLTADVSLTAARKRKHLGSEQIHVALGFGGRPGYAWAFPGRQHVSVGVGVRSRGGKGLRDLFAEWVEALGKAGLLPGEVAAAPSRLNAAAAVVPAGAALEFEQHVGKRTLLIGDAGGFASASTGEGIYPAVWSASLAAPCILRALKADAAGSSLSPCQDELLKFKTAWRQEMAPYLQMPNVNVTFLLPLVFSNQEIADRFARAFLFGENL